MRTGKCCVKIGNLGNTVVSTILYSLVENPLHRMYTRCIEAVVTSMYCLCRVHQCCKGFHIGTPICKLNLDWLKLHLDLLLCKLILLISLNI